jgi:hypothetical protein
MGLLVVDQRAPSGEQRFGRRLTVAIAGCVMSAVLVSCGAPDGRTAAPHPTSQAAADPAPVIESAPGITGSATTGPTRGTAGSTASTAASSATSAAAATAATPTVPEDRRPLVLTYYFYWYNAETGLHLKVTDPLPTHPVPAPPTSYRSAEWHRRQLSDMSRALIDVVLPVYWGEAADPWELWSGPGLAALVDVRRQMVAEGLAPPKIGMFYDTSIIAGLDLRRDENRATFYRHIRDFFNRVPPEDRATIDGKPVVWLFAPQSNEYDQAVFDHATQRFRAEFGVDPYIVRDVAWTKVATSASFPWGAAQNGMLQTDQVAVAGPGYDERQIRGRRGAYRGRDNGNWYRENLTKALGSGRFLVALETWNEFHEASGIGESVEYGRDFIEMTRTLVGELRDTKR